jgi:hypothetical protein
MKKNKTVALKPLAYISSAMRERSQYEQVVLRCEIYDKPGYSPVQLRTELHYGSEVQLWVFDNNLITSDCDQEVYYFWESAGRKVRAQLKKAGFKLTYCGK